MLFVFSVAKQVLLHDLRSPGSTTKRLRPLGKAPLKLMIENPDGYLVTPQLNEDQSDGCILNYIKNVIFRNIVDISRDYDLESQVTVSLIGYFIVNSLDR